MLGILIHRRLLVLTLIKSTGKNQCINVKKKLPPLPNYFQLKLNLSCKTRFLWLNINVKDPYVYFGICSRRPFWTLESLYSGCGPWRKLWPTLPPVMPNLRPTSKKKSIGYSLKVLNDIDIYKIYWLKIFETATQIILVLVT